MNPRIVYTLRGLLSLFITLPLLCQIGVVVFFIVASEGNLSGLLEFFAYLLGAVFLLFCISRGERFAKIYRERMAGAGVIMRYLPVIIAFAYTLGIAFVSISFPIPERGGALAHSVLAMALGHPLSLFLIALAYFMAPMGEWPILLIPLGIEVAFFLGMRLGYRNIESAAPSRGKVWTVAVLFIGMFAFILLRAVSIRSVVYAPEKDERPSIYGRDELKPYRPLSKGNRLVHLREPGLQIASDYPLLDGSTALYPVYAAAAQAIYSGMDEKTFRTMVDSQKTDMAYRRLIKGDADLIMVTPPSKEQLAEAAKADRTLEFTAVGREAFVFFVHRDNPVTGLRSEQLRAIYQKKIRNWSEIGGDNRQILPFQRPQGSGSQTAFLDQVMQGALPAAPLQAEMHSSMGQIIRAIAAYRNSEKAIGYSFRFYLTTMDGNPDVKMLAIDGVEPTPENIRNGTYPFITELYLVSAGSSNPHVQELVDWFRSPKGQALIEEAGYVRVR